MFEISTPTYPYADPWSESFQSRKEALLRKGRRVAYLYEQADSSTFRYRAYNMVSALSGVKGVCAQYFFLGEIEWLIANAARIDVLVLCRIRYSHKVNELITKIRSLGGKIIFDCDDLVFDSSYAHLVVDTLNQDLDHPGVWDYWFSYTSRLGATLKHCDEAIVTNEYLAEHLHAFHKVTTHVVRNFMNSEQLEFSDILFQDKRSKKFLTNNKITIGYFSGSPSHDKDFQIVEETICDLMDEYEQIDVLLVGYLSSQKIPARHPSKVIQYKLHDFINLQRIISLTQINIVPLQDNNFTNCKSELKFFEAAAVGTLTVATPIFSYRNAIRDGAISWLSTEDQWREKLQKAIEIGSDYADMAERAREYALEIYSPEIQLTAIRQALDV